MAYLGKRKAMLKLMKRGRMVGDPGLFKSIGKALKKIQPLKALGKVAGKVLPVIPGVGQAYNLVKSVETTLFPSTKKFYGPGTMLGSLEQAAGFKASGSAVPFTQVGSGGETWTVAPEYGPGGEKQLAGYGPMRRRYRRMNPMNPKAANRAIRRIKSVRKILRSIESSLPKQRATHTRRK